MIAVDCDEQKVKANRKYTDYAFVVDDLSEEALTEVGIQNCGTVGICIGEQIDISILTSMLVLNMGVAHVIAKASSPGHGEVLKRLGVTVVYPEADMAVRIGKRLISATCWDYIALEDGVEVQRIQVNGKMLNKSIRELISADYTALTLLPSNATTVPMWSFRRTLGSRTGTPFW